MKKTVLLYILTIIFIAFMTILISTQFDFSLTINFPKWLHIFLEGINSLLMLLIFLVSSHIYSKTKNERLLIIAGGFLISGIFNIVHIITVNNFPYDSLSITNLQGNPTIIYLLIGNLILPLTIYFALIHKPSESLSEAFQLKIYSFFFFIFLAMIIFPYSIYHFFPQLSYKLNIIIHSLEFINYALFIMLAFIIINIRHGSNQTFFPTFTLGLIISGLGGLFYLNLSYMPVNEISAHILQGLGLILILASINKFLTYSTYLRFKDELVAYLCLLLIAFYVAFVSIASALFHIIFPPVSAYLFLEFILIFQFCIYLISDKITQPITKIIDTLNEYTPGEIPLTISVIRNDELGLLTQKINEMSVLTSQKISEISKIVEREHSIIRVFESMRRVSNQNIIKNSIIEEVKNAINPDRIFIALYNLKNDSFYFDKYIENLPSKTLVNFEKESKKGIIMIKKLNEFLKTSLELCFANIHEYISKNSLEGTTQEKLLKEYDIKSCCNLPIYYAGHLLGCLLIQYTKDFVELDKIDLTYLKTMATQLGTVINNQLEK